MKRRRVIVCCCALLPLGAALSYAVGVGLSLNPLPLRTEDTGRGNGWVGQIRSSFGQVAVTALSEEHAWFDRVPSALNARWEIHEIPSWSRLNRPPTSADSIVWERAAGWPVPCVRSRMWIDRPVQFLEPPAPFSLIPYTGQVADIELNVDGGVVGRSIIDMGTLRVGERVLPLRPIWGGFIIDALLFGLLALPLLSLPGLLRRRRWWLRRREGRCPSCGYDRRHDRSDLCPECGVSMRARPAILTSGLAARSFAAVALVVVATGLFIWSFSASSNVHPIHRAAAQGDVEWLTRLIESGAPVNVAHEVPGPAEFMTALHIAASQSDLQAVKLLLTAGADPNLTAMNGESVLQVAIRAGSSREVIAALLDAGASVNPLAGRISPLMRAAFTGNTEVFDLLMERGASLDQEQHPLAAAAEHAGIVKRMLDMGIDVNHQDIIQRTALMYAASVGAVDTIRLLLKRDADPTLVDFEGRAAKDFISDPEIVAILEQAEREWRAREGNERPDGGEPEAGD